MSCLGPFDRAVGFEKHIGVVIGHAELGLPVAIKIGDGRRAAAPAARQGERPLGQRAVMFLQADIAVGDYHDLRVIVGIEFPDRYKAVCQAVVPIDSPVVAVGG